MEPLFLEGSAVRAAGASLEMLGVGEVVLVASDGVETPRYVVHWPDAPNGELYCEHLETEIVADAGP